MAHRVYRGTEADKYLQTRDKTAREVSRFARPGEQTNITVIFKYL